MNRFQIALAGFVITLVLLVSTPGSSAEVPFSDTSPIAASGTGFLSSVDIDGDGDLDLLGNIGGPILWWENDGNGGGWTEKTVGPGTFPDALVAGDIDGDGDLDLLSSSIIFGMSWWENTSGDGSAWSESSVDSASDGSLTDIDGDGRLDVVGILLAGGLRWWQNTAGDGSSWTIRTVDTTHAIEGPIVSGDFDGDGDTDLLAGGDNNLGWLENTAGDGTTWTHHSIATDHDLLSSLSAADLDGDGDLDVLAATAFQFGPDVENRVGWWENQGASWSWHELEASDVSSLLTSADLDGDGDQDLLRAAYFSHLDWWENTGDGSWTLYAIDADSPLASLPVAADLDQDGDLDVAGSGFTDGTEMWRNETLHRSGFFTEERLVDGDFSGVRRVGTGDIDGDGDTDVIAGTSSGALSWWQSSGGAASWTETTVAGDYFEASRVAVADLDLDGHLDILASSVNPGSIDWWQNTNGDGSTWAMNYIAPALFDAADFAAADLDGDGDTDVIAASLSQGLSWYENGPFTVPPPPPPEGRLKADGDGSNFNEHVVAAGFQASTVDVADFDGDGDLDILAPDYTGDAICWWENTLGDGSAWTEHDVVTGFNGASAARAADVDGNGTVDVVGSAQNDAQTRWWSNDGTGAGWTEGLVHDSAGEDLTISDLDLDGDPDVVQLASDGRVYWYESVEKGASWVQRAVFLAVAGPGNVATADLDRDGDPDVLAIDSVTDDVSWFPNRGAQISQFTLSEVVSTQVAEGAADIQIFWTQAMHLGRAGDADAELASLVLLFEEAEGDPLTDAELNALVESVHVYRDDEDLVFEPEEDDLFLTATPPYSLATGALQMMVADGVAGAQIPWQAEGAGSAPARFFVSLDIADGASTATPSSFRVTALFADDDPARSGFEMSSTDIPLSLEPSVSTISPLLTVVGAPDISVSPTSVDFSEVETGQSSATEPITISSTGGSDLTVSSIQLIGADAADFQIISGGDPGTVATGADRVVEVICAPGGLGAKSSTLRMVSDDPGEPTVDVSLSCLGVIPADQIFADGFESGDTSAWS